MRHFIKLLAVSLTVCSTGLATSALAEFPERAIKMVVPFGAGTSTDLVARAIGDEMSKSLGQPVVIENRAGAGGSIGTQEVVAADPDGYTLSMGTVGTLAINKAIYPNLPYDPQADLTPLAFIGYTPTLLVVNADSPYQTLDDLIAASKGPDGVVFASAGNGTSGHLAGEKLKVATGGDMIHVPFSSGAEGLTAVLSGEVDFMFYHPVAALPNIEAGTMRALGVSGKAGSPVAPDVKPINDTVEDFDLIAWWLVAGPVNLPDDVTQKLVSALGDSLETDSVKAHFKTNGIQLGGIGYDGLPEFVASEIEEWGAIAEAAKARVE